MRRLCAVLRDQVCGYISVDHSYAEIERPVASVNVRLFPEQEDDDGREEVTHDANEPTPTSRAPCTSSKISSQRLRLPNRLQAKFELSSNRLCGRRAYRGSLHRCSAMTYQTAPNGFSAVCCIQAQTHEYSTIFTIEWKVSTVESKEMVCISSRYGGEQSGSKG